MMIKSLVKTLNQAESCRVFILFQDRPSVRPTFLSGKVGKTIVICKT